MPKIGHLVDGEFVTVAQNFDILNAPECTEHSSGLMSASDKKRLNESYTSNDIASDDTIKNLFKKGEK